VLSVIATSIIVTNGAIKDALMNAENIFIPNNGAKVSQN